MKYNFDTVIDRKKTDCEKYSNNLSVFGTDDILPLWIADMDFASADFIVNALADRANHGVFGYACRCKGFWKAVQYWLSAKTGWEIEADWLLFSPGVVSGLVFSILSNSKEGEGILIQPPVYHPFANVIKANNRTIVNNPLIKNNDGTYSIDFEDFEEKTKLAKVFILCNPQNPTGKVYTKEELQRIGEICLKNNVTVISDEIHMDFVFAPAKHLHFATVDPRFADITITMTAPSKSFNIAGLCTAYAVIPNKELRDNYLTEMCKIHCDNSNVFGTVALKAAYTPEGQEWMEQMNEYLISNIDFTIDFLEKNLPNVKCHKPEATFLLWLDFNNFGLTQDELVEFLVKEAKLGLNDGRIYGEGGDGFMRINIGAPKLTIEQALNQLLDAAKKRGLA